MPLNFEKHASKGNEFLNELMKELGTQNRAQAGRMLIAFMRTLRNHLTLKENFDLISQLPMALKSLYVDQWVPEAYHKRVRNVEDFILEMIENDSGSGWRDFHGQADAVSAMRKILKVLNQYVTSGELYDVAAVLPQHLKEFFLGEIRQDALK
jgi:uncharacterized protein (DUF2267 family)